MSAGPAFLVEDLNTQVAEVPVPDESNDVPSSRPNGFAELDGIVYFAADDWDSHSLRAANGIELWRTDGTPAGSWLVRDACPGCAAGGPHELTVMNGALFFVHEDISLNQQIWRSDGTAAGTHVVTRVRSAGNVSEFSLVTNGEKLFYLLDDLVHGRELWISDGTTGGSRMVRDISPGAPSSTPAFSPFAGRPELVLVNGEVFFAADDGVHGRELWRSDGTEAGTLLVADLNPGPLGSNPGFLATADGRLFFAATEPVHGAELWRSDGSEAGTQIVVDIRPGPDGSGPAYVAAAGGLLFFVADDGVHGTEAWRSDGSEAGTVLLRDINEGAAATFDRPADVQFWSGYARAPEFTAMNGLVLFKADRRRLAVDGSSSASALELWRSDGSSAGTTLVAELPEPPIAARSFTAYRSSLVFAVRSELWKSDGTEAGTVRLKRFAPVGDITADSFAVAGGYVYFSADDGDGAELWRTDATNSGTAQAADLNPGRSDAIRFDWRDSPAVDVGGTLFFAATDRPACEPTVWRTDGTAGGTSHVPGFEACVGRSPQAFGALAGQLYFVGHESPTGFELWQSDGVGETVGLVADLNPGPGDGVGYELGAAPSLGRLFFAGRDPEAGSELWAMPGPVRVADIQAGSGQSLPREFLDVDGTVFFSADDGIHGRELWRTDGTVAGTKLVADIHLGPAGSDPDVLTRADGGLFFVADDGVHGREVWRTDGSVAGTALTRDVFSGDGYPTWLVRAAGAIFFPGYDEERGYELWATDGSEIGTRLVRDIHPGPSPSTLLWAAVGLERQLLFFADDGEHGIELWRSDGTESGTHLVKDAHPGRADFFSVYAPHSTAVGDRMVFTASDGISGLELWQSDGTEEGTCQVQDIAAGAGSSTPAGFIRSGSHLFFGADDGVHGAELWAIGLAELDLAGRCSAPAPSPAPMSTATASRSSSGCRIEPASSARPAATLLLLAGLLAGAGRRSRIARSGRTGATRDR